MSDHGALRKLAQAKRASAARARRLVAALFLDTDKAQLLRYAEELEAEATELERRAAVTVDSVARPQQQVQQQNATVAPPEPKQEPKS